MKRKKYCSTVCASEHQKKLGVRKGQSPNSLETCIRLYGLVEGTNIYEKRVQRMSEFLKKNPIKNRPPVSETTKKKLSEIGKERFRKLKESKIGMNIEEYNTKKSKYDSIYTTGAYDNLKSKMKGVFSLNWFIDKYGEIEGQRKYHERCAHIKATTFLKQYNKMNKNNTSNISQELFNRIMTVFNTDDKVYYHTKNHEYSCGTNFNYDFVVLGINKIIEFNGDKFHANPKIYMAMDTPNPFIPNLTASQIWTYDNDKINAALEKGFKVLVVWESDFRKSPDSVIEQCLNFLRND